MASSSRFASEQGGGEQASRGVVPSLVRFEKVSKIFQTEAVMTTALSDVSLSIEKGAFVAITGPSGCGKSTLLSVLGLLETPTVGNYLFDGIDVGTLSAAGRARLRNRALGFVFQSFNLIGDLTVEQNVELPLVYRGVAPSSRRERAGSLLQRLGLMARRDHYPAQLSGGQQQRVAIARALVGEPTMILADEPTGNLDSGTGAKTLALLQELNAEGATICMVTHDHAIASAAKVQIEMLDGRLASRGP